MPTLFYSPYLTVEVCVTVCSRIQSWLKWCVQAQNILTESEIEFASTSLQRPQKTHIKDMKYIKKKKKESQLSHRKQFQFFIHFQLILLKQ